MKWNKDYLRRTLRYYANINDHIDTDDAAQRIRNSIWFRGPNVWILAFSIVIASVGLNVNSTAVIIGAMLISPLMGPIIGVGLALGTNDVDLLKNALKNLLVMVLISLVASTLFFLLSPLNLTNPPCVHTAAAHSHPGQSAPDEPSAFCGPRHLCAAEAQNGNLSHCYPRFQSSVSCRPDRRPISGMGSLCLTPGRQCPARGHSHSLPV